MVRRQTGMLTSKADPGSSALRGRNPSPNAALYIDSQWKWPPWLSLSQRTASILSCPRNLPPSRSR